ncbi:MAG: ABC transporter ATP-binding protein [Bacillales bacterium]|nr:ABC transporter ATP-binding protein [Bacillales bacterium]
MANNEIILELKDVNKKFDDSYAVENFNLNVKKGEFVTFLGPSGCGKTTTLRMIAGFEIPTSGQILLNGQDIGQLPPYKRPLNTVFQRYALFPHLDVYDNIAFGLKLRKLPYKTKDKKGNVVTKYRKYTREEIDEKVVAALKIVDLEAFESRNVTTLSGGQQQRVAIARAIVNEPEILLLDEPLGALDLKMRKEMQLELKAMHKKLGITFIYVTHDQEEALTMSDTIVVMKDGQIQQIGSPMNIYNEPANAFVADFIGESNIYVGTMTGSKKVRFLTSTWDCVDDFPINEKVDVVVRPEDIKIVPVNKGNVNAKIISKIFKGIHYQFTAMVGNNEVLIQSTEDSPVDIEVGLSIAPDLIQIMEREFTSNVYEDGYINKNNKVVFAGATWDCDVTQLVEGSSLDEDGYFIAKGKKYDLNDLDVIVDVDMHDIEISDDLEAGNIVGEIIQMVWKGDHYQLIIRTEDEEDFVVDTEWTWNEFDKVSVKINPSKIKLKLKDDLSKYEI